MISPERPTSRESVFFTVKEACAFLGCSRSSLYRHMRAGLLEPDGRVGRQPRFTRQTLEAFVRRGRLPGDSMGNRPGSEVQHAIQDKNPAQANRRAGDTTGRPEPVPGTCEMERPTNGPKEEERRHGQDAGQGGGAQGGAQVRGSYDEAYQRAVQRLRRAVDEGSRA